jgi:hypothetical protein
MALRHSRLLNTLGALVLVAGVASPALAGPPLVCFPFDIGPATSLPFDTNGWKGMRADYDVSHLTGDTIALLTPSTPILVRMETLRRASLYGTRDQQAARRLLDALLARAKSAATSSGSDAGLAEFDAGYLVETYRQAGPISAASAAMVKDIDGYAMVSHSLAVRHNDPAIAFAAALMAPGGKADRAEHVKLAKSGIQSDLLLARNIEHVQ